METKRVKKNFLFATKIIWGTLFAEKYASKMKNGCYFVNFTNFFKKYEPRKFLI